MLNYCINDVSNYCVNDVIYYAKLLCIILYIYFQFYESFYEITPYTFKVTCISPELIWLQLQDLFSKFDKLRLERVVGSGKVGKILQGEKKIYTFS